MRDQVLSKSDNCIPHCCEQHLGVQQGGGFTLYGAVVDGLDFRTLKSSPNSAQLAARAAQFTAPLGMTHSGNAEKACAMSLLLEVTRARFSRRVQLVCFTGHAKVSRRSAPRLDWMEIEGAARELAGFDLNADSLNTSKALLRAGRTSFAHVLGLRQCSRHASSSRTQILKTLPSFPAQAR